jgi:exopolyphosphatase
VRIEPVGSTASLVADHVAALAPHRALTADEATLLAATIGLDTANLSPAAGRATPLDRHVLGQLAPLAVGLVNQ